MEVNRTTGVEVLEEPVSTPVLVSPIQQVSGLRQLLYIALGCFFVGLAILGAILPVMPCTPFVLAASYFFARSSPKLHRWLRRVPYFGHVIRDWETHRGIRPSIKIFAICCVTAFITFTIVFTGAPIWAKWSCGILGAVGVGVILFGVRTVGRRDNGPVQSN